MRFKKYYYFSLFCCFGSIANAQFWGFSEPVKLSDEVNSPAEETTPWLVTKDGIKELYFVRTFDMRNTGGVNDQDIWVSTQNASGSWGEAEIVNAINNENHNAVGAIRGNKAYVLSSDKKNNAPAIKIAEMINSAGLAYKKWGVPKSTDFELSSINLPSSQIGFTVSSDEKYLVLSMNGVNSLGAEDLYLVDLTTGELTHLGDQVNSTGYEISPFLSEKNDTLFYASSGLGGEGGCDIFYSVRGKTMTEWSAPVNMGKSINSSGFDAYLFKGGNTIYWSSNRNGSHADLYTANILFPPALVISLTGTNVSTFQGSDGKADLTVKSGVAPYTYKWNNGGTFEDIFQLRKGTYSVLVKDAIGQITSASVEITEPSPAVQKVIRLPEVRYQLNSWKFVNDHMIQSFDSLAIVAKLLNDYPGMSLELISHTDARGNDKKNMELSFNRARAVFTYLVKEKGIDGRRLIPVGKGETDPATIKDPLSGLVLVLDESYINTFKTSNPAEFERLHQINRRTEGKIVSMTFDPDSIPEVNPQLFIDINP
jgi:outer membrane protein OmpA-like peptidoglycan-associated protein